MKHSQKGVGLVGILIIVAVMGTLGVSSVRLAPVYIDNWSLNNILKQVVEAQNNTETSPAQVRTAISKQFTTNRVETIKVSDITIQPDGNVILVDASYEKRVPLLFNIDAVVKFEEVRYEIQRR
ncbi:DUF4845 domain-containing protein [Spongiibacter sp. KMU-158]|uniref:DUF4845 domain-containing protein n=1 Tax=Spongiibacter pelagi TaxID=2760804 RepID=A0A927C0P8_9GAMM|nr:DUF4845 domain-containing protein [Spongiibacter pelagi]MBD2858579.1 DUF4845 domain-containing protein [Spongiibacter pelagi]